MRFTDSRRLTGPNVYFAVCGVVLEAFEEAHDDARRAAWQSARQPDGQCAALAGTGVPHETASKGRDLGVHSAARPAVCAT